MSAGDVAERRIAEMRAYAKIGAVYESAPGVVVAKLARMVREAADDIEASRAEVAALRRQLEERGNVVTERHLDESDAWMAARAWLESIRFSHKIDECQSSSGDKNGGILSAWSRSELVAMTVVVRDDRNHSILVRLDALRSGEAGKEVHDAGKAD